MVISRTPPTPPYDDRIIPCTISKYTAEKLDNPSGAASQPIAKNSPYAAYAMWFIMFLPKHSKFVNHPNPQINGLLVQKNHAPFFAVAESHDVLRGKTMPASIPKRAQRFSAKQCCHWPWQELSAAARPTALGCRAQTSPAGSSEKVRLGDAGPTNRKWVKKMTVIYGISSLVYGIIWDYIC